jgi:hypothetical protein
MNSKIVCKLGIKQALAESQEAADATRSQLLITGNDEKVSFDETGKTVTHPPGKDTASIIDIEDPTKRGSSPTCP